MNRHPAALMLSLIGLFLVVIGLAQLHKVWKHMLLAAVVIGAIMGWVVYFDLLSQPLW